MSYYAVVGDMLLYKKNDEYTTHRELVNYGDVLTIYSFIVNNAIR